MAVVVAMAAVVVVVAMTTIAVVEVVVVVTTTIVAGAVVVAPAKAAGTRARAATETFFWQTSFYLKYAKSLRETLVTECDTDKAWFVADRELRACTANEKEACHQKDQARATPRGAPQIVKVGTPGQVIRAGPVCTKSFNGTLRATGATRNRFIWWRLSRVHEARVEPCKTTTKGATSIPRWIDVNTIVSCAHGDASCEN